MKKLLLFAILMTAWLGTSAHRTGIYFYFDNIDKHVYEDENVRVFLCPTDDGKICVLVNNKTNKVLYIDNGSSFFYTNGRAASMYRARATTSGTMESSGTAVNLGGIASAFGARGPVATALSAIVVSHSSGNYNGTIVSEKRIIPVAPMSTEPVYVEDYSVCYTLCKLGRAEYNYKVDGESEKIMEVKGYGNRHLRLVEKGNKIKMKKGMERQYNAQNSIMSCKALLHYSFTENMNDEKEVMVDNYLKALVIDKRDGVKNYESATLEFCDKYRQAPEEYTLFESRPDGWNTNPMTMVGIIAGPLALVGIILGIVL